LRVSAGTKMVEAHGSANAMLINHISPGILQFTYTAKQQILNTVLWWSIFSDRQWSGSLAFPDNHLTRSEKDMIPYCIKIKKI
jgi:hypothetical protein